MFCSKCGNELEENADFCYQCGAKVNKSKQAVQVNSQANKELCLDRTAMLLYLREILDLEIAKKRIENIISAEKQRFNNNWHELNDANLEREPGEPSIKVGQLTGGIITAVIGLWLFSYWTTIKRSYAMFGNIWRDIVMVAMIVFLAMGGILIFFAVGEYLEDKKKRMEAIEYNRLERLRIEANASETKKLEKNWKDRSEFLSGEYRKVKKLLKNNYQIGVVPNPHRNLASIYYIYDYMNSSQESFTMVLLHGHLEEGIQEILSKLDEIIRQNERIILQNRRMESKNDDLINNNKKMLKSLQNTETNTKLAAQYGEISANYCEANAYFGLATYLKR